MRSAASAGDRLVSDVSVRTRTAVAAGRAMGWLSRVTGRGAGATISGRVINALGRPLRNAKVSVEGQSESVTTARDG